MKPIRSEDSVCQHGGSVWKTYHVMNEGLFLDQSGSVMTTLNIEMDGTLYLGLWREFKRYNLHVVCVVMQQEC